MRPRTLAAALLALVVVAMVATRPGLLRPDVRPSGFKADVLVVGGSPAGVAAALAAARQGMVVVLTEPRPFLGTVWTGAMLNMIDLSRVPGRQEHLIRGIFLELYRQIGRITFDPRRVRAILREKIEAEPGITLLTRTELVRPVVASARVRGAVVRLPDGAEARMTATVTIDATDDADLAAAAGVPYTYGRETSGIDRRAMPATLMFRLADVDWPEVVRYAYAHRRGRQPSGAFDGYAWGYREAMREYRPSDPRLSAQDLNIGRLPDGTVLVNALQVHDVDGTSRASRIEGYERAKREIPRLVEYMRRNCPGFARARLVEVAPELYIRETRHIRGLYVLTARDIAERTLFWDRVAVASYPVDLHAYNPGERYPYRPVRQPYTIPLRSLIPARIDGLFVSSRAFSATYQAAGSARVVPTTIAMGQAAGTAAAVAVLSRVTPHVLAERRDLVREVQRRLVRDGALIEF
ncbi:MAG: FAD-dependent oxidoreductase [Armatimonadota bacterium]|nr:FAD-dependent oxidoreductase [Armatimonadota bacterium]MDR7518644.1 FAD-dependent oxidoreductase [Armatimonadota bacterium]MDR7549835.1 FAD-dependent oxidoreductase [Armatimonadota bacterium]